VTDQNPAEPQQTGVHESFGPSPSVHESFGVAPASGSGLGHESAGSAPAPNFTATAVPASPVPAQSASPAMERTGPVVGTAPVPTGPAPGAPVGSATPAAESAGSTPAESAPAPPATPPVVAAPAGEPSPAKGGAWKWIVSGAVIIAVAVAAIAIILVRTNRAQDVINAIAVGDCVDSTQYEPELGSIPSTPTVSCDDPKATHKVIGIVDGQSAAALDNDAVCTPWPQTTATIWLGEHDKSGKIYCLADLGR
jgi:hypothetical protein